MSLFTVEILPAAEAEFREAFLWYLDRSPYACDGFRTEVLDTIDALETDADAWPENELGFRYRVLDDYPYTIFYDLVGTAVTVVAIAHHRRRPGYWGARLPTKHR